MKKKQSKYKRKLIIDNEVWTWQVQGKKSHSLAVLICSPENKKYKVMVNQDLYDQDSDDCDNGCCCNYCLFGERPSSPITPEKIKALINQYSKNGFKDFKAYSTI